MKTVFVCISNTTFFIAVLVGNPSKGRQETPHLNLKPRKTQILGVKDNYPALNSLV